MQLESAAFRGIYKGFRKLFDDATNSVVPFHPKVAMKTQSSAAEELYAWLGAVPGLKEMFGELTIRNIAANDWTIRNREWGDAVGVSRADIERDRLGVYTPLFQALGEAAAEHPDELLADLLLNAFTANDYTGSAFCSATKKHEPSNNKSPTFNNKMVKQLTATHYATAKAMIKSLKNAAGRPMNLGKDLVLVCGPALEDAALKIIKATTVEAGGTNVQAGSARLEVFNRLGDSPYWFLMEAGKSVKPFIFQQEVAPELNAQTEAGQSETVLLQAKYLYAAYARHNFGYGMPQLIVGSTGADA